MIGQQLLAILFGTGVALGASAAVAFYSISPPKRRSCCMNASCAARMRMHAFTFTIRAKPTNTYTHTLWTVLKLYCLCLHLNTPSMSILLNNTAQQPHASFDQKDQGDRLQRGQSWKQSFHSCTRTVRQCICEGDHLHLLTHSPTHPTTTHTPHPLQHTHTKIAARTLSATKYINRYAYHLSD
jgi:hypothetical protein